MLRKSPHSVPLRASILACRRRSLSRLAMSFWRVEITVFWFMLNKRATRAKLPHTSYKESISRLRAVIAGSGFFGIFGFLVGVVVYGVD